jgi:uncharacterized membrane protein YfcA
LPTFLPFITIPGRSCATTWRGVIPTRSLEASLPNWLALLLIFFAVFTQTLTGFGSGLVAMAFLPGLLGVQTAVPLMVLVSASMELILLIRLRAHFNLQAVWRLMLTAVLGIPLGVWALRGLSERTLLLVLGIVMAGYALYALFNFKLPGLEHPAWAYPVGFLSGLLSGTYGVGGPPVIIYAACRGWKPGEFKSNLQGFFLIGNTLALVSHAIAGNLTRSVWSNYLYALPAIALGLLAGTVLDRCVNPQLFRKLVLILLVIMGLRFILSAVIG